MGEEVGVVASQGGGCKWSFDLMLPLSLSLFVHFSSSSSPTFQANLQALVLVDLFLNGQLFGHLWQIYEKMRGKGLQKKGINGLTN